MRAKGAPLRLDLALADLAARLSTRASPCRGVMPTPQGDLLLSFGNKPADTRLLLSHRSSDAVTYPRMRMGDFSLHQIKASDESILPRIAEKLQRLWSANAIRWLCCRNREHHPIEARPNSLLGLLTELVAVGRPFWHNWRLTDVRRDNSDTIRFSLPFEQPGDTSPGVLLAIDAARKPLAGERAITDTPLGSFALGLALHAGMHWVELSETQDSPPPEEAPAAELQCQRGLDDTWLEHCFRTAHGWDQPHSLMFDTWGDADFYAMLPLLNDNSPWVFHGSRECPVTTAALSASFGRGSTPYGKLRFAWLHKIGKALLTDVDDAAVVFGGEARLQAAIEDAATAAGDSPVQVTLGCDYHLIGDDVTGVCRCMSDAGKPARLLNPPLPRFTDAMSGNWWRVAFEGQSSVEASREAGTFNLAGFGWQDEPMIHELVDLLERTGGRAQSVFFPGRDLRFSDSARRAAMTVTLPWEPVQQVLAPVLDELDFPVMAPVAPYGEGATRKWLTAVANALGTQVPSDASWNDWQGELAPDLQALRAQASEIQVGIVADRGEAVEVCEPRFFFGLDPIDFLLDLGFVVRVVGHNTRHVAERYRELRSSWRERLLLSDVPAGANPLDLLVPDQQLRLVYCDVGTAQVSKSRGINPFTIRDLEPGLAGACRTARRLLSCARQRLYSDYGSYLLPTRDAHG